MMTYCRLCAEAKSEEDLCASINDSKSNILEKLVICCQWNSYPITDELPDRVCCLCSEKLEKCWLFSECVAQAQQKLQQLMNDGELTIKTEPQLDEDLMCENTESIFVEPITLPEIITTEPNNELIGSTIENIDESMLSQHRECDICHKIFTTGYNLKVNFLNEIFYFTAFTKYFKTISGSQKNAYE